jgi:hypothetical protein
MPAQLDLLKADANIIFEDPIAPATATRAVLLPGYGLTLRKLDPEERVYAPDGKYLETIVILQNWLAEGLESLFAFEAPFVLDPEIADQKEEDKAKLLYQLSNDGGTTWFVWQDGPDAWVPATGSLETVFNDLEMVDRRLPLFPLCAPRQVRIKVKLIPGAKGRQRPVLCNTLIYNDHEKDLMEDVSRSLKRFLDREFTVPMTYNGEIATPSTTLCIEKDAGLDVKIEEPIKVFNLKNDPCKQFNLFSSLAEDGRTITMLGPQVGQVEVKFAGRPEVFIGAEEFFQISKIPSVVVFVNNMVGYTDIRTWVPDRQRSISRGVGKLELARIFFFIFVTIRAQSSLRRESLQMIDKLSEIIDWGTVFPSVAGGDHYCVMEQQTHVTEHRVEQGLFVTALNAKIMGSIWLRPGDNEANVYKELGLTPIVKEVHTHVGSEFSCNLNLPKHVRRVYRERSILKPE